MANLKRYGERENKFGLWQLLQCDDGEYVKFDDIKELLNTDAQQLKAEIAALVKRRDHAVEQNYIDAGFKNKLWDELRQLSAI